MIVWRYFDSGPNIGVYNMAIDEELLAQAQAGETTPVLRFYAWCPPAVSLGRFQKSETAVNTKVCKERGIDIVRRITGGRAVLHDCELTYSIISRTDNPLFPSDVHGTYKIIAAGLLSGFKNLGIQAEMVSRSSRHAALVKKDIGNFSCFSSPAWYEIIVNGKKIVGSAQRRVTGAFLQHGSILMKYNPMLEAEVIPGGGTSEAVTCIGWELLRDVTLEEVKQAFKQGFAQALGIMFV